MHSLLSWRLPLLAHAVRWLGLDTVLVRDTGLVRGGVKKVKKKKKKDEAAPGAGGDDHEDEEEEDFPEMEFKAERWINLQVAPHAWAASRGAVARKGTRVHAVG